MRHRKKRKQFHTAVPTPHSTDAPDSMFGSGGEILAWNPNLAEKDKDFQKWYSQNTLEGKGKMPYSDKLDYDYFSYYKNNNRKGITSGHFPDTYKRPNHETFSDESIYAGNGSKGYWKGDTFISREKNLTQFNEDLKKELNIKMGPARDSSKIAQRRDYYDINTDSMFFSRPLFDANDTTDFFINEAPHALQRRNMGKENMQNKFTNDILKYGHQDSTYDKPGTIEYDAHTGAYRDSIMNKLDEYKKGGWIPKNLKRGRCTPMGTARCPKGSPQYNLALTFKKHHGFHEEGGQINSWINPNMVYDKISYNRIGDPQFGYGGVINPNFQSSIGHQAFNSQAEPAMEIPEKKVKNPGFMRRGGRIRYDGGGATYSWDFGNPNATQYNAPQPQTYTMDPNQVTGSALPQQQTISGGNSYAGYANTALNVISAYNRAGSNPNATQGQKTASGVNAGVNSVIGTYLPWYGLAQGASAAGKSTLNYDENGIGKTATDRQANNLMTAPHETAINHAGNGDWWAALGSISSGGLSDNVADAFNLDPNTMRKKRRPNIPYDPSMIRDSVNANYNNSYSQGYAEGGMTPTTNINIEGNELMVNPKGTIVRDFKHYPAHPETGMDPMGDVVVPEGNTIIPKNRRKYFQDASRDSRKTIIKGLQIMQQNREKMARGGYVGNYNSQYNRFGGPEDNSLSYVGYDPGMFAQNVMGGQAYTQQQGTQGSLDDILMRPTQGNPYNMAGPRMENGRYTSYNPAYEVNTPGKYYGPMGPQVPEGFKRRGNPGEGVNPDWRGYSNTALEYLAPAYNIGMGLFDKVNKLNADNYMSRPIQAHHVSDEDSLREIGTGYNTGLYNLKNSGNYSRGSQVALAGQRMKAAAASRERLANSNTEIDNRVEAQNAEIDARNKGIRFNVDDWNAKSKAAKRNQLDQGIGQLSDTYRWSEANNMQEEALQAEYPQYKRRRTRLRKTV